MNMGMLLNFFFFFLISINQSFASAVSFSETIDEKFYDKGINTANADKIDNLILYLSCGLIIDYLQEENMFLLLGENNRNNIDLLAEKCKLFMAACEKEGEFFMDHELLESCNKTFMIMTLHIEDHLETKMDISEDEMSSRLDFISSFLTAMKRKSEKQPIKREKKSKKSDKDGDNLSPPRCRRKSSGFKQLNIPEALANIQDYAPELIKSPRSDRSGSSRKVRREKSSLPINKIPESPRKEEIKMRDSTGDANNKPSPGPKLKRKKSLSRTNAILKNS